jgi:hypothetical protein
MPKSETPCTDLACKGTFWYLPFKFEFEKSGLAVIHSTSLHTSANFWTLGYGDFSIVWTGAVKHF